MFKVGRTYTYMAGTEEISGYEEFIVYDVRRDVGLLPNQTYIEFLIYDKKVGWVYVNSKEYFPV